MKADQVELPGMPEHHTPRPRKGSKAWKIAEKERFWALAKQHDGMTSSFFAAATLGVSKSRVFQLVDQGVLNPVEVWGKLLFPCDELLKVAAMERPSGAHGHGVLDRLAAA